MSETSSKSMRFSDSDLPLFLMAGGFAMWRSWKSIGFHKTRATYDLYIRDLPENRNFFVFTGLEEIIHDIINWKFQPKDIGALLEYDLIDQEMADELADFKFDIDIAAMPEGTVCFPNEPVMRLTGSIYKLELLYLYIVNAVTSNTVFSSKCIRVVLAAKDKTFVLPTTRSQSFESSFKCMRAMYICGGTPSSSQLSFWNKYGLKPEKAFTASTHAFIKSFDSEEYAMFVYGDTFHDSLVPMLVDTYNFENGIENFVRAAKKLKEKHHQVSLLVYLDSGDLIQGAYHARRRLDEEDLHEVQIIASGNINEYKVREIVDQGVPIDMFLGITEIVNSSDAPSLEAVYKLAQLETEQGARGVMKLAKGKKSYPGRKQVFRISDHNGKWLKDVLALEDEECEGQKLLLPFLKNGQLVREIPELPAIREYVITQLEKLPDRLKSLESAHYELEFSPGMLKLIDSVAHK